MKYLLPLVALLTLSCPALEHTLLGPEPVPISEDAALTPEEASMVASAREATADKPDALAEIEALVLELRRERTPAPDSKTPLELLLGLSGIGGSLLYAGSKRSRKHMLGFFRNVLACRLPSAAKSFGSMVGLGSGSLLDALHSAALAAEREGNIPASEAVASFSQKLKDTHVQA
jgi:hypothetical protein